MTPIVDQILEEACKKYTGRLGEIFAAPEGHFQNSEFHLLTDRLGIRNKKIEAKTESAQGLEFKSLKLKGSTELTITLPKKKEVDPTTPKRAIDTAIRQVIFSCDFPIPFIFSAERTGVTIFRQELNFVRDRLLEEMRRAGRLITSDNLFLKSYQNYPGPIEKNMEFLQERWLKYTIENQSSIAKEYPEVLADFADIVGGEYVITEKDILYYTPKDTRLKLPMDQSSSAARSLLNLGF